MTKISNSFADLLLSDDDPGETAIIRAEKLFSVYKKSFERYNEYHILDAQFNVIFDREYPDSPHVKKYFEANSRVLEIFTSLFSDGFKDGTLNVPETDGKMDPEQSAHMFLNVINSYVEKISLRKALMEEEQGISMKEELSRFINYLIESLRSAN